VLSLIETQDQTVRITPSGAAGQRRLLTPAAIQFLARLSLRFEPQRRRLLAMRRARRQEIADGRQPDFPVETADVRAAPWKIAAPRADLQDRRVQITGAIDRQSIVDGLNSGASVFVADFEDSTSPTWQNILDGHVALCEAARGALDGLCEAPATLMLRPRGWHLVERHFQVDGEPISASLFDFGLFFFHNVRALIAEGTGPYFSLPKLESRYEARLWNDVFLAAQDALGISRGVIRAAAQIDHVLAALEMDEILWELREHSAGLTFGHWGYIASYVSTFRHRTDYLLPDPSELNMNRRFLASCAEQLVAVCHRRGAHAIGGVSCEIPLEHDTPTNQFALIRVREDKLREAWAGYDGTQVAHPWLIPHARDVFDTYMPFPHQLERKKQACATAEDLHCAPTGEVTDEGLAAAIDIGLRYLAGWLSGRGCTPVGGLLENAASADVCRVLMWQRTPQAGGMIDAHVEELRSQIPERELAMASRLMKEMTTAGEFTDFMSAHAYRCL
jgi:malate synthase